MNDMVFGEQHEKDKERAIQLHMMVSTLNAAIRDASGAGLSVVVEVDDRDGPTLSEGRSLFIGPRITVKVSRPLP